MACKTIDKSIIDDALKLVHLTLKMPQKKMWIDYDEEADVLYISFKRPQKATDTEMTDDGILLRYKDGVLVGITILDASKR